jgi:TolA-binding protein
MESQDTVTLYLLKIWTAYEANKNRFIGGAIAVVLIILLGLLWSWHKGQVEINAGQAISQLIASSQPNATPSQLAGQYLAIAGEYSGTQAAQRALLQGASVLFTSGDYAGAQTQFQKFTANYPTSQLLATSQLGQAACLEALGKPDAALDAYQKVVDAYPSSASAVSAQFALGRIYEQQGKFADALRYYQVVAHAVGSTTIGRQAMLKTAELSANLAAKAAVSPAIKVPLAAPTATPAK